MSGVGSFDTDRFGVPRRVLSLSDDFYGALGRVAALGAVVELRMSDIVVAWGRETSDTGQFMNYLTDRFKEIMKSRVHAGLEVPEGLIQAVAAAKTVMKERNELLHSLWPREDTGWRNRRDGALPTSHVGLQDVGEVIGRLVKVIDSLGPYLYSPIQPTPLAAVRGRKHVPMWQALKAHDQGTNKGRAPLSDDYRVDAWSKAKVKTRELRTVHGDFHSGVLWPLGKEQLMTDNLESVREMIEAGAWPRSDDIVAGIQGNAPAVHAELVPTGDLYLIDGQLRVLTALWHGVAEIEAYLVEVDRSRSSS